MSYAAEIFIRFSALILNCREEGGESYYSSENLSQPTPKQRKPDKLSAVLLWLSRPHSCRKATIGSIFVARRAGTKQASKATSSNTKGATRNIVGSVVVTPLAK
jgi:hypothetical protein